MAEGEHTAAGVDVLHPLARLHSVRCHSWEERVNPVHCVLLQDIVAILQWEGYDCGDIVYISSTNDLSSWTSTELPHYNTSLSTYQDQLVAVGGRNFDILTNKLLTSSNGRHWQSTLPAMPTARDTASTVSAKSPAAILVVAGGYGSHDQDLDIVEVLLGNQWSTVAPLPTACREMRSTLCAGSIYFTSKPNYFSTMYTCTCESLCAAHDDRTSIRVWTENQVPHDTMTIASCASRPVSIDKNNVIRGYSNGHWTEMTIEENLEYEYRMTDSIAAAELPTGGLVVANGNGVYTLTISVGTFDPDSQFISNVLSRLEAVMGLKIVSALASIYQQFTTSSGVTLEPRYDRYEELLSPDPQTAPGKYVEKVVLQWSIGQSPRPPTWRELLHVFQEVGQLNLRQQIEAFMKGEMKFVDAYRHFISTKDVLELFFLKFLFVGPPRLGKTTLRRRLMGEITDLISAGEAEQCHPSTAAVESGHSVIVRSLSNTTAVIAQADWSAAESLTDEARMVFHNFVDSMETNALPKSTSGSAPVVPIKTAAASSKASLPASSTRAHFVAVPKPSRLNKFISKIKSLKLGYRHKHYDDSPDYHDRPDHHDIPEVAAIIKECYHPDFWKEAKHAFKAYLRMEDTGGQPELMDMLPALTVGPGLYLLFFNYKFDLKSEFKVFYQSTTGETSLPELSTVTLEEMLLSTLSSISCSGSTSAKDENSSDMQHILQSSKSMVYFVGTHKDQVTEDHIASFDEELQKIIRDTDFFENGLVHFFSENRLVISIDNMGGGAGEVDEVRKLLEVAMEHHFKKLRIPAVWLLFSLCLRTREVRTASVEECLELSRLFNMSVYETKTALWFLHHHAGVMMYFPDVLGLEDLVIIDIQIVYDSVTHLILRAMQFGKVSLAKAEKFRRSGQFVLQDLINITCNISGDLIPHLKLIALLEYLHIIARIDPTMQSVSSAEPKNETVYIMPCVLYSASKVTLDSVFGGVCPAHHISPLMVRYKCGFVPIGVFPAMIASLIANGSFQLVENGMMKNLVQFRYGSLHALVSFVCCPKFYGIIISELPLVECEPHRLCVDIRKEVESTLEKVSSRMNYGYFMDYHFAFECPSHPGRDHLCVFEGDVAEPKLMLCFQDLKNKVPVVMKECHKVWFGVELTLVCENSACSPLHSIETVSDEQSVKLFKKEIPTLVEAIHHSIASVGDSCYGEDLISDDTYDHLRLPAVTDRDKARKLLMNVKEVISQDPQAVKKFLEILKKYSLCEAFVTKNSGNSMTI